MTLDEMYNQEPEVLRNTEVIHHVRTLGAKLSKDNMWARIGVDQYGSISVYQASEPFGPRSTSEARHLSNREVYDWLCEHELACWRAIGPEDTEIFATRKLDPERGVD